MFFYKKVSSIYSMAKMLKKEKLRIPIIKINIIFPSFTIWWKKSIIEPNMEKISLGSFFWSELFLDENTFWGKWSEMIMEQVHSVQFWILNYFAFVLLLCESFWEQFKIKFGLKIFLFLLSRDSRSKLLFRQNFEEENLTACPLFAPT